MSTTIIINFVLFCKSTKNINWQIRQLIFFKINNCTKSKYISRMKKNSEGEVYIY